MRTPQEERARQFLLGGESEPLGPAPGVQPSVEADDPSQARKSSTARLAAGHAYRLLGPPGCGKTTALATSWVPKAVDRFGRSDVVVCSLTRTAAREIVSRDIDLPRENVGTLHALAFRALGRPPLAQDKKWIEDWNSSCTPHYRLTAAGGSLDDLPTEAVGANKGDALLESVEQLRHRCVPVDHWPAKTRAFFDRWTAWKQEHQVFDFTDLIEKAVDFTDHAPGEPKVLIVDEAQDLSKLEMRLVEHWGAVTEFFVLAGDADQSIFEWRGADAEAFLSADVPQDHVYKLTQSYRVPQAVQEYASRWIDKVEKRYPVEYKPKDELGECRIDRGSSMRKLPRLLRELQEDATRGETSMVLATCSFMLRSLVRELRQRGIPFHNPYRVTNGQWNPMRGGVDRLRTFLAPVRKELQGEGAEARFWTWGEVDRWVDPLRATSDFVRGAKTLAHERAQNDKTGEPMTRSELRSVFTDEGWEAVGAALSGTDDEAVSWYEQRILPKRRKQLAYAIKMARKHGIGMLAEDPKLIIGTIHSVKGGGVDNVYLAPDLSMSGAKEYAKRGPGRDGIVRTFYVGMTRAQKKLVLLGAGKGSSVRWLPVKQENEA